MADWLEREAGKLCKWLQDEIDERPLDPITKRKFIRMLQKCADQAKDAADDDRLGAFNRSLKDANRAYVRATGRPFSKTRLLG